MAALHNPENQIRDAEWRKLKRAMTEWL